MGGHQNMNKFWLCKKQYEPYWTGASKWKTVNTSENKPLEDHWSCSSPIILPMLNLWMFTSKAISIASIQSNSAQHHKTAEATFAQAFGGTLLALRDKAVTMSCSEIWEKFPALLTKWRFRIASAWLSQWVSLLLNGETCGGGYTDNKQGTIQH